MVNQDMDKMVNLAMEKQNLIEKFLKLTEEQAEAISNDNYDSILNTINRKQRIMEKVNLLDLNYQGMMPEDDEELRLINNNTREIMARAIAIDDNNIMSLKNHQAEVFEKIKNAKTNKVTHSVYRGKRINIEGILLDAKK